LLMNFQSRLEADSGIVAVGHFAERFKRHSVALPDGKT
jgi:hypothetical protein